MATDETPPEERGAVDGATERRSGPAPDGDRTDDDPTDADRTHAEREAVHEVELGLEWLQRAQGNLLEFHHATGHGMDHLYRAETVLRETGHDDLADRIREDLLPHGVVDEDRWSYDVLENFQETLLAETASLEHRVRQELTDGQRHVCERRQEREWKERARDRDRRGSG